MELPNNYTLARIISSAAYLKVDMRATETNAELKFRRLSVYDTRVHTNSVFRDIMVPMTEVDDQFLMTVKMDGILTLTHGVNSDYLITIDRAKLILEIDHMISVRDFGLLPFAAPPVPQSVPSQPQGRLSARLIFIDPGFYF
jgi:vacuolar protein sorting-associated protein 13A/C